MNYYDPSFPVLRRNSRAWLKRDIETLIEMRSNGATFKEIGERLGRTKNAVSGFVHRARQEGGLAAMLGKAPKNAFERQFTTKIEVKPEQYVNSATCFRCGARSGFCEHTEGLQW